MAQRITDKLVKSLKTPDAGRQRIVFDAGPDRIKGFGVRVNGMSMRNPDGARSFILEYWLGGAQRRFTIGRYPTWSVEAARREAKVLRKRIDQGDDPLAARATTRKAPTVKDLCNRYEIEHLPGKADGTKARDREMIRKDVLPALGKRKVVDIHHGDAKALHRKITDAPRNAPVRANRVLSLVSRLFNLASIPKEGETEPWRTPLQPNPAKGVERNPEAGRDRFFSEAEIDRIATALTEYPGEHVANMLRFVMLTGARPDEAIKATWDQVDIEAGTWTKPAHYTKQRKLHRVPLTPAATELLQQARGVVDADCPYLFPGRKTKARGWQPIKQYRSAWGWIRDKAELEPDAEGRAARVYDLRHTFAATGAGQGLSLYIIGALLGHTTARTTERYAHLADDPLRQAAEKIGGAIANAGKKTDNVVSLKGGRGS